MEASLWTVNQQGGKLAKKNAWTVQSGCELNFVHPITTPSPTPAPPSFCEEDLKTMNYRTKDKFAKMCESWYLADKDKDGFLTKDEFEVLWNDMAVCKSVGW